MLRNLRFQSKLVLVLMVPLCALAVFSAIGVRTRQSVLDAHQQYTELSKPFGALSSLSAALEQESVATAWFVATSSAQGDGALENARGATDDAVEQLDAVLPDFDAAGIGESTDRVLASLGDRLETLGPQRDRIDELVEGPAVSRDYFLELDDQAIEVAEHMARELADRQVSAGLFGIIDLHRAAQASAREAGVVVPALATGDISAEERAEFSTAVDAQTGARSRFSSIATEDEQRAFEASEDANRSVIEQTSEPKPGALLARLPAITVTASEWYDLNTRKAAVFDEGITFVRDAVSNTADAEESSASDAVLRYALGALLSMGLAVAIALVVARQTTKPLKALTRAARDVSQRQLPELVDAMRRGGEPTLDGLGPLPATSRDEIGELSAAFNTIQSMAVQVAREQSALLRRGISDLFVNLARRNQSLLDRQIELIDRLEADEQDPDALQALFRLDHLATRMRRNADSLLVLADSEQLRRWDEPVPLLDVVRSAAAEIADFARVTITGLDQQPAVNGGVAADLTHLMAELLENATSFSPPHTPVTVKGSNYGDHVVIAISDEGLGMPEDRLAEANQLLDDPPAAGLALSRILGLYVVGHLAARHGIVVELRPGDERGLTALVAIPIRVLDRGTASALEPTTTAVAVPAPSAPANGNGNGLPTRAPDREPEPAVPFWSVEDHLPAREPGRNLLHLPMRRDGLIDVGSDPSLIAQPGRSRADEVRSLLAEHRRGIERADEIEDEPEPSRKDER